MTWLTPLTGLFLALAVIPPLLLLYFLKLRRKPQPIACTLLWKRSVEDLQANAPFQRIRWNILLLLQLLALLLLILSVMQPRVQAARPVGGRTVFLIDNSASMSAADMPGGATRLEVAKRLAKERIEQMYAGGLFSGAPGEAMVVAFSESGEIFARFTNSRQQLTAAIDRIPQTHGETRLDDALKLARAFTVNVVNELGEMRPTGEPAHIELISDGRIGDLAEQVLRGESLTYHAVGTENPDNVAIAAIAAERPFDRPTAIEVFASLINFNREPVTCDVQLSVNGTALGIREVRVPAAEDDPATGAIIAGRNNIVFAPFEQPRNAVIEVAVLRQDDLMADNAAHLIVPPPRRLAVALVTAKRAERSILRMAFEGMPIIERLEILRPAQFDSLAASGTVDMYDVVVLDDYAPQEMPPGRYLTFGATPPIAGLSEYGRRTEWTMILDSRDAHPVLRYVNLNDLMISDARLVQPGDDIEVLAEGNAGPVILTVRRGALHVVHLTFDVLDSTWPRGFSYVTFLQNAVEYLGHSGEALTTAGFRPGEALTARLPATATEIDLRTPPPNSRTERLTPADPTQLSWGPILHAGVYILSWNEPGPSGTVRETRAFAANLLSESEGEVAVAREIQIGQSRHTGRLADGTRYVPLWPWALGLCLALLMVEWWMYHRKTAV